MSAPVIDPELLRAFVAVAELLSFTRAAGRLHRTQATVSLQVKRLEERLGVVLLRRSTARVELTEAGEGFLVDARRILALNEFALAKLAERQVVGCVRIGVMEDYGTRLLPGLLAAAAKHVPLVQVEIEIGLTARMLRRLGVSFDAVIAMHPEGTVEGELLRREEAVWAAASDRATETLDPLPLALSTSDCLFRGWATRALDRAGRKWRLAYISPSLAAVEAVVARGLAVTVLKRSMLAPGLRAVPDAKQVPSLPSAEIRLHRAVTLSHAAAQVVNHLARGLRAESIDPF